VRAARAAAQRGVCGASGCLLQPPARPQPRLTSPVPPRPAPCSYAFLDIIAKCVFGFVLLMSHSAMDNSIGVTFGVPEFEEVAAAPAAAPAAKSTKVVSETPAEVAV